MKVASALQKWGTALSIKSVTKIRSVLVPRQRASGSIKARFVPLRGKARSRRTLRIGGHQCGDRSGEAGVGYHYRGAELVMHGDDWQLLAFPIISMLEAVIADKVLRVVPATRSRMIADWNGMIITASMVAVRKLSQ
jgi:hypothetical protein